MQGKSTWPMPTVLYLHTNSRFIMWKYAKADSELSSAIILGHIISIKEMALMRNAVLVPVRV